MTTTFYGSVPEVKYFVHIYNISPKTFKVQRPLFSRFTAIGCPSDERYIKVASIRHPFPELDHESDDTSQVRIREHVAERVAQDICNPENTTLDQNFIAPDSFNIDGNLNLQGLFWSKNNPPTEAELKDAEKRLENRYRNLLEKAAALDRVNPKELQERITPEWHDAADYFGIETSWHQKRTKKAPEIEKINCPNCDELIKPGLAYHFVEGIACIAPTSEAWKRAVTAGIKKRSDVPEGMEFWPLEEPVAVETKSSKK